MVEGSEDKGKLEIPALGRNVGLGYLYDERTDQFDTRSVFDKDITSAQVDFYPNTKPNIDSVLTNSYKEKFRLYNIDASIAANILSGQLQVNGSAHYLKDENQSALDVTGILKVELHTAMEYLKSHTTECSKYYNKNLPNTTAATHYVSGIEWGGAVAIEFKNTVQKVADKQEIDGKLNIVFEKLKGVFEVSGAGSVDIKSTDKSEKSSFKLSVRGDISLPTQLPSTYQQVQELIQSVPQLIAKTNGGKGVPLKYHLLPISTLKEHLQLQFQQSSFAKQIEQGLLQSFVNIFDEISATEQELNDVFNQLWNNKACVHKREQQKIKDLREGFRTSKSNFSTKMLKTLKSVRSGAEESLLNAIIKEYEKDKFSYVNVMKEVDFSVAFSKVQMYQTIQRMYPEVKYFGQANDLQSALLESLKDCVYVLYKFNDVNSDHWAETQKIFYITLNKPFNRLFLVDCDFPFPMSADFPKDQSVIQQVFEGITKVKDVLAEMKLSPKSDPLILKAVGRQAELGQLYDARTDTFIDGSLLKDKYTDSVEYTSVPYDPKTNYVPTERFQDKCNALGINSEQQFSILANSSSLARSGKYLALDEQSNVLLYKKSPVMSFVHTRDLTQRSVKITDPNLLQNVTLDAVNKGATHFVNKIVYGFNSVFSVKHLELPENTSLYCRTNAPSNSGDFSSQYERLQAYTANLKTVINSVNETNGQDQFAELKGDFVTTVYSDIQGETSEPDVLRNREELQHFVNTKFIASLTNTKSNGMATAYELYPLSNLVQEIGMLSPYMAYGTLATVEGVCPSVIADIFDSINLAKEQIRQMNDYFKAHNCAVTDADYETLEKVKEEFECKLEKYKPQFQKIVRDIKSGDASSVDLYFTHLKQYQNSNFFDRENRFIGLAKLRSIENKVHFCKYLKDKNISFLGRDPGELELKKLLTESLNTTIYFLHYHPEWTVKEEWVKTLNFFLRTMKEATTEGAERTFYVINAEFGHSISTNITGPVIHEYRKGLLSCYNVVSAKIKEEVTTETKIEKLENEVRTTMMEELKTQITNLERTMGLNMNDAINNTGTRMAELTDGINALIQKMGAIDGTIGTLKDELKGEISNGLQRTAAQISRLDQFGLLCEGAVRTEMETINYTASQNRYYLLTAKQVLSQNATKYASLGCSGTIQLPSKGESIVLDFNLAPTKGASQRCLWTLDATQNNERVDFKVKLTLLCQNPPQLLEDNTLTFTEWYGFKGITTKRISNYWDDKAFLSFNAKTLDSEAGFILRLDVLDTTEYSYSSSSATHTESVGSASYSLPSGNWDYSSIVINPTPAAKMTLTVDVNSSDYYNEDVDSVDILEFGMDGVPKLLGRLSGGKLSTYVTENPVAALFLWSDCYGEGVKLSWK